MSQGCQRTCPSPKYWPFVSHTAFILVELGLKNGSTYRKGLVLTLRSICYVFTTLILLDLCFLNTSGYATSDSTVANCSLPKGFRAVGTGGARGEGAGGHMPPPRFWQIQVMPF